MKGKEDFIKDYYSPYRIDILVCAAECIACNNKDFNGQPLYDIDSYFDKWQAEIIKKRMAKPQQ